MANLFGRTYSRNELLQKVGDISQVAGVKPYILTDGRSAGVEAVDFRTGSGFAFTVLPGRAMDISYAEWRGIPLCWRSQTGDVAGAFYEPEGIGWLRGFAGGLLATCGLTQAGAPCVDADEQLGLHGRIGYIPATNVAADAGWDGDEYSMWARGKVREAVVFGTNLQLTRRISARLGENRLLIEDRVENMAFQPTPHMIIYHINIGFPVVDEGAVLLCPSKKITPRDDIAAAGLPDYDKVEPPQADFAEHVYYHELAAGEDGNTLFGIVNRGFAGGHGIGVYVKCRTGQLPTLVEWKMNGAGTYVMGIEPTNAASAGGRAWEREQGTLPMLGPGESRDYQVEIGVLTSLAEIESFERQVQAMRSRPGFFDYSM
ncbi:MAG: aldose 1-epimerase family protein [Chloroflexi bacterium]|nr:aldose 1-epimerase family protein [Chloroflexota bacterium]